VKTIWKDVKCTKQFALIAVKNVKFPSNLTAQDQYTAESALLKEGPQDQIGHIEDINTVFTGYQQIKDSLYFFRSLSFFDMLSATAHLETLSTNRSLFFSL